jgi:acetyltransferase-like isoleucine patch superfamily enzyme
MTHFKLFILSLYKKSLDFFMLFSIVRRKRETEDTNTPIYFKHWFFQKFIGKNRNIYWQVHPQSVIRGERNIFAGVEVSPGFERGCYIQAINPIYIGDYTQIANSVGIISANHDLHDTRAHLNANPIIIGSYCWIGMGAIILPEVEIGDFTIVGAGSIVTKSFTDGYCVIAGNPAKIIRVLDKEKCKQYKSKNEYFGFYKAGNEFNNYIRKNLNEGIREIVRKKNVHNII